MVSAVPQLSDRVSALDPPALWLALCEPPTDCAAPDESVWPVLPLTPALVESAVPVDAAWPLLAEADVPQFALWLCAWPEESAWPVD
jgi:hypothetical protein